MTIKLTESAAAHIRNIAASTGGLGLKLGVKKVGCSGLAYTYDIAKSIDDGDLLVEAHDAKLVVGKDALPFVQGSELDYVRDGFKQMLTVNNPNVKSTCGCGESFNV